MLEEANDSGWVAPSFEQPKAKTNRFRLLSDFRKLNRQFKLKPYPIQKIRETLLKLEVFKYATSFYLNMSCYHICISEQASNLCTNIQS